MVDKHHIKLSHGQLEFDLESRQSHIVEIINATSYEG